MKQTNYPLPSVDVCAIKWGAGIFKVGFIGGLPPNTNQWKVCWNTINTLKGVCKFNWLTFGIKVAPAGDGHHAQWDKLCNSISRWYIKKK